VGGGSGGGGSSTTRIGGGNGGTDAFEIGAGAAVPERELAAVKAAATEFGMDRAGSVSIPSSSSMSGSGLTEGWGEARGGLGRAVQVETS